MITSILVTAPLLLLHLRHPKCAVWSPYIFILLTTTLITVHEVSKRFKKQPVPMQKSPAAPPRLLSWADQEHVNWHPAAHVSLPLAPPTTSTAHSIQRLITPALFKRSRPLQPSLASSVHLCAAPQCQQAIAASGNFYLNYTTFYCGLFLWSW